MDRGVPTTSAYPGRSGNIPSWAAGASDSMILADTSFAGLLGIIVMLLAILTTLVAVVKKAVQLVKIVDGQLDAMHENTETNRLNTDAIKSLSGDLDSFKTAVGSELEGFREDIAPVVRIVKQHDAELARQSEAIKRLETEQETTSRRKPKAA